jgi:hypothetical protein
MGECKLLQLYCQNVHKNRRWTHNILESQQHESNIILLQELPFYMIKRLPTLNTKHPLGIPVHGTNSHPQWALIQPHQSNISAYINKWLLKQYSIMVDLATTWDKNILILILTPILDTPSSRKWTIINFYNDCLNPSTTELTWTVSKLRKVGGGNMVDQWQQV